MRALQKMKAQQKRIKQTMMLDVDKKQVKENAKEKLRKN
jgi:hypothetical protein